MKHLCNYTPIKDWLTKEPILLNEMVESEKGHQGFLKWCDFYNRYYIKSISGGNIYATKYKKVNSISENNIDNSNVECRKNHLKQKW